MATLSTTMRPLAPAKSAPLTKDGTVGKSNGKAKETILAARKLAPALPRLAPSQAQRPLKPLIAAKPLSTSPSQRPILAAAAPVSSSSSSSLANQKNASSSKKIIPLAPSQNVEIRKPVKSESPFSLSESSEGNQSESPHPITPSPSIDGQMNANDAKGNEIVVVPKREWILPARAKPGRKPSEVEPPTRRKAQNRASQRAFRERRQSYVNSLEQKITEFEQKGLQIQIELQKVSRKLKEENDLLKQRNFNLEQKVIQLETLLGEQQEQQKQQQQRRQSIKMEEISKPSSPIATTTQHEAGMSVSMLLEDAPRRKSWDWLGSSDQNTTVQNHILIDGGDVGIGRDCGFCTEQSPCVCSGEAVLDFHSSQTESQQTQQKQKTTSSSTKALPLRRRFHFRDGGKQKLWYTTPINSHEYERPIQVCPTVNTRKFTSIHPMQSGRLPTMIRRNTDMLPPIQSLPIHKPKPSLWPVYPLTSPSSLQEQHKQPFQSSKPPTVFRMRKTIPGSVQPVCSGNPKDCSACSTDPALAAFCQAVSLHLEDDDQNVGNEDRRNAVILDAGNALPLRRRRQRGLSNQTSSTIPFTPQSLYTNGTDVSNQGAGTKAKYPSLPHPRPKLWSVSSSGYSPINQRSSGIEPSTPLSRNTNSYGGTISTNGLETNQGVESIPEAWQRIKEHPSFAEWQGGLDLLADVVTRKSSSMSSNSMNLDDEEEQEQEEEMKNKKRNQMDLVEEEEHHHHQQDSSPSKQTTSNERNIQDQQTNKRRRLFVERKRVDDVLALMDKGTPINHSETQNACACPLSKIL